MIKFTYRDGTVIETDDREYAERVGLQEGYGPIKEIVEPTPRSRDPQAPYNTGSGWHLTEFEKANPRLAALGVLARSGDTIARVAYMAYRSDADLEVAERLSRATDHTS